MECTQEGGKEGTTKSTRGTKELNPYVPLVVSSLLVLCLPSFRSFVAFPKTFAYTPAKRTAEKPKIIVGACLVLRLGHTGHRRLQMNIEN